MFQSQDLQLKRQIQCWGSETIIFSSLRAIANPGQDPDPTWQVITDSDPTLHIISTRNFKFCYKIELFTPKIVFLIFHFSSNLTLNDNLKSGSKQVISDLDPDPTGQVITDPILIRKKFMIRSDPDPQQWSKLLKN